VHEGHIWMREGHIQVPQWHIRLLVGQTQVSKGCIRVPQRHALV
jgi:hypothetical protein